jgi:hypothetical protein
MTPAERARQIDQEEFAAECKAVRERAIVYAQQKRDERRRDLLVTVYGEAGKSMPLYPNVKDDTPKYGITYAGLTLTRHEWAKRLGISAGTLKFRIGKHGAEAAIAMGGKQRVGRPPKRANDNAPGVVSNFCPIEGTGAGRHLQESPEITFHGKAIIE